MKHNVQGNGEPLTYDELMARYEQLQKRVTRFSVVEQRLIELGGLLDREVGRFDRINAFSTAALHAESDASFAQMVADALLDVFEQEIGVFWVVDEDGQLNQVPAAIAGVRSNPSAVARLGPWMGSLVAGAKTTGYVLSPELLANQPDGLGLCHAVVGCCRDESGRLLAVLFTGVTSLMSAFHDKLPEGQVQSFHVFTQQVAALFVNRTKEAIIARQMQQIQQSEERMLLAMEAGEAGFWDWSVQTNRVVYSAAWKQMLGCADDEVGDSFAEWQSRVHPEDLQRSLDLLQDHLAGNTPVYENLHRLRCRGGSYVWVLSKGRAVRDENGRCTRLVGTHFDMTRHKELEERLREAEDLQRTARKQAEAANRAKSIFVASMSHEIRTPMNGVLGMLQLLRETHLSETQSSLVCTAEKAAMSLLEVIGDILDLSKIEAGKVQIKRETFELEKALHEVMAMMRLRADAKDILLDLKLLNVTSSWVTGDGGRLRQVLINLVGNAIKFTDRGRVSVEVECDEPAGSKKTFVLHCAVRDTGIGISPEDLKNLFKPFNQLDASSHRMHGGTGLGLAISRALVEMMGGTISVKSVPGQGSVFTFTVKLAAASPPKRKKPALPAVSKVSVQGRVLVVDDSLLGQTVTKLMLETSGLSVEVASDGAEAVAKAMASRFDLILMDCQMPTMDGFEATAKIREHYEATGKKRVPIIALTANVQPADVAECLSSGMDSYLPKPVIKEVLMSTMSDYLGDGTRQGAIA